MMVARLCSLLSCCRPPDTVSLVLPPRFANKNTQHDTRLFAGADDCVGLRDWVGGKKNIWQRRTANKKKFKPWFSGRSGPMAGGSGYFIGAVEQEQGKK